MTRLTATAARREFFEVVKRAANGHRVYRIHHRQGAVVLMSEEDYESLMESIELLSLPGFRAGIRRSVAQMKRGETLSFDEVFGARK